jgi:hypothetical protein
VRTTAFPLSVLVLSCGVSAVSCSGSGAAVGLPTTLPSTGGVTSAGGYTGSGGVGNPGGASAGGNDSANGGSSVTIDTRTTGGESSVGGAPTTGGNASTGGSVATGGKATSGGAATGGVATGGAATGGAGTKAIGGAATGGAGTKATGGAATGGTKAAGGSTATGGAPSTSTGTSVVDCSAPMPTGGEDHTGTSVNGTINGLNYGIWTNGSGGTITVFGNAHAFATSWNESQNFLAHLGLDFNTAKPYTSYGTITAQFSEIKSGTAGNFSMIGIYGWTHNPCVEWYINEDSYNGLYGSGSVTATIDGAVYYLSTNTTTGTGGANACEIRSYRQLDSVP